MLYGYATVGIIAAAAAAVFVACCVHIARAAFGEGASRIEARLACFWGLAFALDVVGCLALSDAFGDGAAALCSAALCILAFAAGRALSRSWAARDAAEAARVDELRSLADRCRAEGDSLEARAARAARAFMLTRREEEMLALLLKGRTRSEIARELYVSDNTVKTHIRNLYRKMGVGGREDLAESMEAARDRRDGEGLLPSGVSDR